MKSEDIEIIPVQMKSMKRLFEQRSLKKIVISGTTALPTLQSYKKRKVL